MNNNLDRPPWQERAACRGAGPHIFYLTRGQRSSEALTYCRRCPVLLDCRNHALHNEDHGIWGGLAGDKELRRARHHAGITRRTIPILPDLDDDGTEDTTSEDTA